MIHPLILSGILLYISGAAVHTLKLNIAVKSGSSGIIPCVYDKQYKENRKYLCKGLVWSSCRILAYANETGKYSITDYSDQSIFTVRWDSLETADSGKYWCAVEIGDYGTIDTSYYLYLTIQSAPDVSVESSSVSGHEGGNVSVQCFYTSGYQYKLKQWCRYKDQSCYTVGRNDTSQNSSVQISDDGRSSFTVLMTGLRLSDSGWYLCSVGDLQVPVQLNVNEPNRVPDVSVMNSSVSGHEGGNVSVQCFYTSGYQYKLKQWCRYKDQSCYTVGRNDTSQNSSVQISDDGRRSFTVLMTGLRLSDSGWYFCSVRDLQVPVQLIVIKPKCVTNIPTAPPSDSETDMFTTQSSANRNPTTVTTTDSRPETHIDETNPSLIAASETIATEIHSKDEQNKDLRHVNMLLFQKMNLLCIKNENSFV
ncbi:polymeric immunoglobulin receptor-like [Ctenopharyngodon idella]|uniref:polymeric immunoglobulin receptor-like n=1 Tax=Ctenopharyngodon idella TaxID=7959 RepID=UPI00223027F0|nr:polymeric immunoglobulin receptor-like [Ctenopharyngodon idella]